MPEHAEPYLGTELELFRHALNWKSYLAAQIRPFLRGAVLEVGAGIGSTTDFLGADHAEEWVCLEPDSVMAGQLRKRLQAGELPPGAQVETGVLADLAAGRCFDTILYIDVLEHIEDDRAEFVAAAGRLTEAGRVVILSPAYQWLYSPFDRAIGHFRRYSKRSLRAVTPAGLHCERMRYLDSVGVMASGANRFLMKQGMPTAKQLRFWDRVLVPLSRLCDPLTGFCFGKSILGVWRPGV